VPGNPASAFCYTVGKSFERFSNLAVKQRVTDEIWTDQRIKGFLDYKPWNSSSGADFQLLYRAYKYMRPKDFGRFLVFFCGAGHDLEATDDRGRRLEQVIENHRFAELFIAELRRARQTASPETPACPTATTAGC